MGKKTIQGGFNYAKSLYEATTIVGYIETYKEILKQISLLQDHKSEEHKIKELLYLNKESYNQIVYDWNATSKDYPREKCIHTLFEEQVARTPLAIAVVYEDNRLTYRELNEKANQLAHYLLDIYNIKPDDLIGLCLDRSENMLIAILAALKSGGAYVPMDPSYPDDRIAYIIKDTNTKVVLTNAIYQDRLADILLESNPGLLSVDQHDAQIDSCPISNPLSTTIAGNLAYIIYTSGTTGNPKGVMIEHRGVVNLAIMQGTFFGLRTNNKEKLVKNCLWFSNYVFDAHVFEGIYISNSRSSLIYYKQ